MDGIKIKVQLREKGGLDDQAHAVLLRAVQAGAARPTGAKQIDQQPGKVGVAVYLERADYANIEARAGRMTAMSGELTMPAEYVAGRIVKEYLHDNGPKSDQEVAALETMYGARTLLSGSRQGVGERLYLYAYVNPQEYGALELLARKASKESVADLLTDRVIPDFCRDNPLGGDMGKVAMKSIYGKDEAVKEVDPHAGIRNPHGPRPVIVPGR